MVDQFTVGSAVGGPVTRSSGIYGSCLVPRCMGLPLGLCSEDLGEKISSRSAGGSTDSEAVIRCIYGMCVCARVCVCVCAQSCPALCNPINCSSPSSSVYGIFQARMLEWIVISSCKGSNLNLRPASLVSSA